MDIGAVVEHVLKRARWGASRSSGPGGQHRDKASTRAELTVDWDSLAGLDSAVAERLAERLGLDDRPLRILIQVERSLTRNRQIAAERLGELVAGALAVPPPPRRPTRPSWAVRKARLAEKSHRAGDQAPATGAAHRHVTRASGAPIGRSRGPTSSGWRRRTCGGDDGIRLTGESRSARWEFLDAVAGVGTPRRGSASRLVRHRARLTLGMRLWWTAARGVNRSWPRLESFPMNLTHPAGAPPVPRTNGYATCSNTPIGRPQRWS